MSINLIGFLGYACLIMFGVGAVLYALLWAVNKLRKEPEIF